MRDIKVIVFLLTLPVVGVLLGIEDRTKMDNTPVTVVEESASTGSILPVIDRDVQLGKEITKDRAYFGAPPPHPHRRVSGLKCLSCHAKEDDLKKKHRAIEPVPHEEYSQCTQCHVDGSSREYAPFTDRNIPFVENYFSGLDYPGRGSRANDYSPPTVPHKTFMRENCQSCHGPSGDNAIRTPHPKRSQCLQCHMPEQAMDYTRTINNKE